MFKSAIPETSSATLGRYTICAVDQAIDLICSGVDTFAKAFELAGFESMMILFTKELADRAAAERSLKYERLEERNIR
jgi:predicted HTH domain antitoxin